MELTDAQHRAVTAARRALEIKRAGLADGRPQPPAYWSGWLDAALTVLLRDLGEDIPHMNTPGDAS